MKQRFIFWVENYFYDPSVFERLLSYFLFPFSALYCFVVYIKYKVTTPENMGIKVISVGNLTVGGSGKTPLVTAMAKEYDNVAVVLRGYGRKSSGLVVVKEGGKILCDVQTSGDEAMLYAKKLKNGVVIVSEDRKAGIKKAKELGASLVFLDDGYSKHGIEKLDFLIDVKTPNRFCLPSGPYREKLWAGKKAWILKEGKDFHRKVVLKNPTQKMVLVTAIARPHRLDPYLPKEVKERYYFEDHHDFSKEEIAEIFKKHRPDSLLVTCKDYVKLEKFGFPLSILDLDVHAEAWIFEKIEAYRLH